MTDQNTPSRGDFKSRNRLFAIGGVAGAILASSCCILPLILVTLGVSGAWIGNLTALDAYKPIFVGVALVLIGLGFWHVYVKPKKACEEDSYCATDNSTRITRISLWVASVLVLLAITIDYWAPLFY